MIKLFRNIRQNLLAEGKTTRYLKYAIGEIILVVIGILIAVKINAWANTSKLHSDNKIFLEKMIVELHLNKTRMNNLISHNATPDFPYVGLEQALKNCDSLLKLTYRGLTYADTTFIFNNELTNGGSFLNLHTGIYDELINTGKLYSIGSDSLTTAIKAYYKRCEGEDLYNKGNTEDMEAGLNQIEGTYYKICLDRDLNPAKFNILEYPWLIDAHSKEYQNLQSAIAKIMSAQNQNLFKMKQIIQYSDSLIDTIKKEQKNTYD